MRPIAKRMAQIPFSAIRTMLERVTKLEKAGADIIHLEVGSPDFDTPQHIKQACQQAINDGQVQYTSNYGIMPLREAISAKFSADNQLDYDPQNEIIVTNGVSQGIVATMLALLDPGDEVLIMAPIFPAYQSAAQMAGAATVTVPVYAKNDYQPQMGDLIAAKTQQTKMVVITTPGNPSGVVFNRQTLQHIADFAIDNDLLVISDEIYEKIIYDNCEHVSIGALPGMRERTITLNGFSKSHAMTGWRLGYIGGDAPLVDAIIRIHQNSVVCATTFAQWGGVAALEGTQQPTLAMVEECDRRRRLMIEQLQKIPQISFVRPQGAMYIFIDVTDAPLDAFELANALLEKVNIAVVPWDERHIRLSYGNSYENLEIAMKRMQDYFAGRSDGVRDLESQINPIKSKC
ncbi:MAG: pyridoxal phosphate-dependent aminotransferase [Algicola sp.]|nr:pyridoxal phosphate-dependent aminotransferase [Algicola sp.]